MQVDTLIHARWLIPIEPNAVILEHHSLAITAGRIVDLLPSEAATEQFQAGHVEHFEHHVVLPGLINCHTHAAMTLMRGIADDLPLMEWLQQHIWPLEQRWMSEAYVRDGSDLAIAEMIRGGTTCFSDMYFFPEITAAEALHHGIRANIGLIVIDFPSIWAQNSAEYIEKGLALHDQFRHEPLISTSFAPHAPYTVSDEPLKKIRMFADELDLSTQMHVHETRHEVEEAVASTGMSPLQRLAQLGLLNPLLMAVHMTQLTEADIDRVAEAGAHIIHCPESNLKLASGFCEVAKCLEAGINVALGTDGAASNNDLDMFGEMRTAALLAKTVAGNASAVPAMTALRMATINGARALGLDGEIGSLVAGKSADIIAVDLEFVETQPLFCPASQLVYAAGRHQVTDVWVAGRRLLNRRQLTTFNLPDLQAKCREWRQRLAN